MRQKQPAIAMPQVPTNIETPLSASNFSQFRSLQRGAGGVAAAAWQETSTFRPSNAQFRSLQRAKVQDQRASGTVAPAENMYSNSESERQLYAVTEL